MKMKKGVPDWLSVLLLVLALAAVVRDAFVLPDNAPALNIIEFGVELLMFACAVIYCFAGYKKSSAILFKAFCFLYALQSLMSVLGAEGGGTAVDVIIAVSDALCFCIMCAFFLAKNLGHKRSYILAGCLVGLRVLQAILAPVAISVYSIGNLVLAVIFGIILWAKYKDKADRGTD